MKHNLLIILLLMPIMAICQNNQRINKNVDQDSLMQLKSCVEKNPNDIDAHNKIIKYLGIENPDLLVIYEAWLKKFPKSAVVPFAIGEAYANAESPKAKPWLLKAIAIDSTMAKAYFNLWLDGERWGDFIGAREYLKKAMEADPTNPDYAFYYRSGYKDIDTNLYRQGMLEMPKLFPTSERGAQALYWLGIFVKSPKEKEAVYTQLKNTYPPDKFRWSSSGMYNFFYFYLENNPNKALELAKYMLSISTEDRDKKYWNDCSQLADNFAKAKNLISEKKYREALDVIESCKPGRYSQAIELINFMKAETLDALGETQKAYNQLIKYYASTPGDNVWKIIDTYGKKLKKNSNTMKADLWKIWDSIAVPATPFCLEQYMKPGKACLSDFKGKVVLLTYWFPGCGPCRGEFPHFENVIRKYSKDKVEYLAINIAPEQDEYVVPFVKSSGYSFIPLKDEPDKRGNLTAVGAPTNYLIDQNGRIVFKNFRIDADNERMLELMINELLDHTTIK
ncbi:MAG TPA: redoxin family protein [Bacteroidales bacterium]|nr:redoxin family protein [Bacteroidales bacterium]HRT33128.1 redoxin family protein [Bacteroidales bacterium]HRT83865.1 redoxin family protein [Bacteroidales bacterium]